MKLKVTISKTANCDYMLHVMSDDMASVNVVLVAEAIELNDTRNAGARERAP